MYGTDGEQLMPFNALEYHEQKENEKLDFRMIQATKNAFVKQSSGDMKYPNRHVAIVAYSNNANLMIAERKEQTCHSNIQEHQQQNLVIPILADTQMGHSQPSGPATPAKLPAKQGRTSVKVFEVETIETPTKKVKLD